MTAAPLAEFPVLDPGRPNPSPPELRTLRPFEFRGETAEFFRIWIVNLALSVLTLGVYSAWAKVRTQRYFYANTWLSGAPFEYLADPLAILRGRAIAVAASLLYFTFTQFFPGFVWIVILAYVLAMPWVVAQSLRFRAHNSAWCGLRFGFTGRTGQAYKEYLFAYLLLIPTLGLALPYILWRQGRYALQGLRYGALPFRMGARASDFYAIYGLASVAAIGLFIVAIPVGLGIAFVGAALGGDDSQRSVIIGQATYIALWLMVSALNLLLGVFVRTQTANVLWGDAMAGQHGFQSRLRTREMVWLYFSNTVAIIASLGLGIPWARIRSARYRAQRMAVLAQGELEVRAGEGGDVKAGGEELAGFFDLDLGF